MLAPTPRAAPAAAAALRMDAYRIATEPYYRSVGDELALFEAACAQRLPLMLKGPTGCGKTRLVERMAWALQRPLITVACNDDTSVGDLVGRHLLDADGTHWQDGPLTLAVRHGAICYLDEVVEARADTLAVIHPLTDTRRLLPIDRRNELLKAHPDFQLVVSYNPGTPGAPRELKAATRQRFCALDCSYPGTEVEVEIVARESGIPTDLAASLVALGVPAGCIVQPAADAAQFDSESLWQQLQPRVQAGMQVVIVRGDGGRDWLADTLRAAGAQVDFVQAYRRTAPRLRPAEQAALQAALAQPAEHLWLFSSAEAIGHLQFLAPGADWQPAQALATHPRIEARARALGFGRVLFSRPSFDAVARAARALHGTHE